jgi:spermidine/putrescine transport system ATP-binding protein
LADYTIKIEKLKVKIGRQVILNNISASVKRGDWLTLLGPSGSGKTTLIRAIAGFIQPTEGSIELLGTDMRGTPPERRPVSMLFQKPALFDNLTVKENALIGLLRREEISIAHQKVDDLANAFDFKQFLNRKVSTLSGGEKQKAAFIRTFANAKEIMLLDEPIHSAFDLHHRRGILQTLKECAQQSNITTIIVTHELEEAAYLSDEVLIIVNGYSSSGSLSKMYIRPEDHVVARVLGYGNEIEAHILFDKHHEHNCPIRIKGNYFRKYNDKKAKCAFFRPNGVKLINGIDFVIESVDFLGTFIRIMLRPNNDNYGGKSIEAAIPLYDEKSYNVGDEVSVEVPADCISLFDPAGKRI